jgi:hypothetical protein
MLEVEGEDRKVVPLGNRHDGGVRKPKVQVGEAGVDLHGSAQEPGREVRNDMLAGCQGPKEQPSGVRSHPRMQELIGLDDHGNWDDEIAPEPSDELGGDPVGLVAPIDGGEERPGVSDDLQLAGTDSAR